MGAENFAKTSELGKEASPDDRSELTTNEILGKDDGKILQVQSNPFESQEMPDELREFFRGIIEELQGPQEIPERQSEGMKKFDQAMDAIDLASIKAFKENQPLFRDSLKATDDHLVKAVDAYELEGAESGRFERLATGKAELSENLNKVSKHLKEIPFYNGQVQMIDRVNGYLDPGTDPETKAILLDYIKEEGSPELAQDLVALGKTQDSLRPDITDEKEKRNEIFQAYSEAHEAKQTYYSLLSATMQSPNTNMDDAKAMGQEMRELQTKIRQQQSNFGKYSVQRSSRDEFKIEFPKPKKPKTVTA